MTENKNVRGKISLVDAIWGEDEANRDDGLDDTGGRDIASQLEVRCTLSDAGLRQRRLRAESKSERDE